LCTQNVNNFFLHWAIKLPKCYEGSLIGTIKELDGIPNFSLRVCTKYEIYISKENVEKYLDKLGKKPRRRGEKLKFSRSSN